jgi:hypothetical protein
MTASSNSLNLSKPVGANFILLRGLTDKTRSIIISDSNTCGPFHVKPSGSIKDMNDSGIATCWHGCIFLTKSFLQKSLVGSKHKRFQNSQHKRLNFFGK